MTVWRERSIWLRWSFDGVFEPLLERANFLAVRVHPELGTICWPGGADLDPDVLHAWVTGRPLPPFEEQSKASSSLYGESPRASEARAEERRSTAPGPISRDSPPQPDWGEKSPSGTR